MVVNSLAFPTGEMPSSAVLLDTVTPAKVRAGKPYNDELHVTNLTSRTLNSVNVMATAAQKLDVTASQPEAQRTANGFTWNLGNLPANETRVIRVTGCAARFAPLPSLAAKAKAEWRVVVRANAPKDVRTRALVTSDQLSVPLEKLESTNLYR